MFKALDLKIECRGSEHIPRVGGAVLVSNHISYMDFIFNGLAALPQKRLVRFMAKDSVFRHKISGPLMRGMKHIPVDRKKGEAAYAHALNSLRSGEIIGVFPEATISQSFTLKSFKSGAARLAQEAGVPLIPMALWGTQRIWTKGHPRNFRRSHIPITIRVGEPLEAPADQYAGAITRRLRERMQELLEAAQRAYPVRPKGPEDTWWMPPPGRHRADPGGGTRGRAEGLTPRRPFPPDGRFPVREAPVRRCAAAVSAGPRGRPGAARPVPYGPGRPGGR
ncbi:lysophospholipid acyltransferase family protein [Actinomadura keratinilytica]